MRARQVRLELTQLESLPIGAENGQRDYFPVGNGSRSQLDH